MADVVDRATRSRMMSGIRHRDTKPELKVRSFLHRHGLRFRLHVGQFPGRPDVVLPRHRAAIFVHGCFWHRHKGCRYATNPKNNAAFWRAKLNGNALRDTRHRRELTKLGWRVFTVWECETDDRRLLRLVRRIQNDAR